MVASLAAGSRSAWQYVGTSAFAPGSREVIHPCTHAPPPSLPSASAVHCLARTKPSAFCAPSFHPDSKEWQARRQGDARIPIAHILFCMRALARSGRLLLCFGHACASSCHDQPVPMPMPTIHCRTPQEFLTLTALVEKPTIEYAQSNLTIPGYDEGECDWPYIDNRCVRATAPAP